MKRITLLSVAALSALTIGTFTPLTVRAATYFSDTTKVAQPKEGDTWFRDVGDGTDTLSYENGEWVLEMSDSARRKAAHHQYVTDVYEPNAQAISEATSLQNSYIDNAIKDPNRYQSLPASETMSVYIMRVTDGERFQGTVKIPKVTVPNSVATKMASTFVSDDVPVMLPVINTGDQSSSESSSSSSSSSASSSASNSSSSSISSSVTNNSSSSTNSSESSVSGSSSSSVSALSSSDKAGFNESNTSLNSNTKDSSSTDNPKANKNSESSTATTSANNTVTKDVPNKTTSANAANKPLTTTTGSDDAQLKVSSSSDKASVVATPKNNNNNSPKQLSAIVKKISKKLPQTNEAKNNLATFGILSLITGLIGALSFSRFKNY